MKSRWLTSPRPPLAFGLLLLAIAWVWNWNSPLQGTHSVRQADTLFAAWSYCVEGADFLLPRIAHRGNTSGISIGEFPLVSWIYSVPCKVTGTWSEGAVKALTLLFLILNTALWGFFVKMRWPRRWPGWDWFLIVWLFATHQILHLNIALPDTFALALTAAAGLLAQSPGAFPRSRRVLAGLLFVTVFAIRPYLFPLLILISPSWTFAILTFGFCGLFYLVWFKWWILRSEVNYYATGLTPFSESWKLKGPILESLLFEGLLRNIFNFVGLAWLIQALRQDRDRVLFATAALAFAMVLAVRAPMLISHLYYLNAAFVILLIWMTHGTKGTPWWVAWLFVLIAGVNSQHHWQRQGERNLNALQAEMSRVGFSLGDQVAIYMGHGSANTPYLYWMKTTGWSFNASEDPGAGLCPTGADWKIYQSGGEVIMNACRQKLATPPHDHNSSRFQSDPDIQPK